MLQIIMRNDHLITAGEARISLPFRWCDVWADDDLILDADNPRSRLCRGLGLPPFGRRADAASEDHFAAICLNGDVAGIDQRAAAERFFDFALDLARCDLWLQLDQVGDALDPAEAAHGVFRPFTLVIPLNLPFKCHPAVLDDDTNVLRAERQPCLDRGALS